MCVVCVILLIQERASAAAHTAIATHAKRLQHHVSTTCARAIIHAGDCAKIYELAINFAQSDKCR